MRRADSAEFDGYAGGFGCADVLEDLVCLPQVAVRVGGVASGQGTAAEACQRVGLVPWGADLKRKVKRFLVTPGGLFGVAAD